MLSQLSAVASLISFVCFLGGVLVENATLTTCAGLACLLFCAALSVSLYRAYREDETYYNEDGVE